MPKAAAPINPLLPTTVLALPEFRVDFPIGQLPPNLALAGPVPESSFIESYRVFGQLEPIWLVRNNDEDGYAYLVAAGTRRIKTARILEHTTIQARIWPVGTDVALLAVIENEQRSQNEYRDAEMLTNLIARASAKDILEATGMGKASIDARLIIGRLHPKLKMWGMSGKIATGVMLAAAKETPEIQNKLIKIAEANGDKKSVLTMSDVKDAVRVDKQAVIDANQEVFNFLGADAVPWQQTCRDYLIAARNSVPEVEATWRAKIELLITAL